MTTRRDVAYIVGMPTTGLDLKLERTALRIRTKDLAAAMGVSVARISHLEGQAIVTDDAAAKYRAALATLRTSVLTIWIGRKAGFG